MSTIALHQEVTKLEPDFDKVERLLKEQKADLTLINGSGHTCLTAACTVADTRTMTALLTHGYHYQNKTWVG